MQAHHLIYHDDMALRDQIEADEYNSDDVIELVVMSAILSFALIAMAINYLA